MILDIALNGGGFDRICFLDDDPRKSGKNFCGHLVLGGAEKLDPLSGSSFVVALGDNKIRAKCFDLACRAGLNPAVLVHRTAVISPSAVLGEGTVVMPAAVVNPGARVGRNCIINSGAIVEHDCEIGAHVHISPRAVLGGAARVRDFAHVGIGAVVLPLASIGCESTVGAGAVVLREAPAHAIVVGIPARMRSDFLARGDHR